MASPAKRGLCIFLMSIALFEGAVAGEHPVSVQRLYDDGRYSEALATYYDLPKRVLTAETVQIAVESAWALGLTKVAIAEIQELQKHFPEYYLQHPELLLQRSILAYQAYEWDAATTTINQLIEKAKDRPDLLGEAHTLAAEISRRELDCDLSQSHSRKALEYLGDDKTTDAHVLLALCAYQQGHIEEAREHFQSVSPEHPEARRAVRLLSAIAYDTADYETAKLWIEEGKRVLPEFTHDSWAEYVLAKNYIAQGQNAELEQIVAEAQRKYPASDPWRVLLEALVEGHLGSDRQRSREK